MTRFDALLERFARPEDRTLLQHGAGWRGRARLIARISLRYFWVYLILLLLSFVWVAASGMDVYHRTEMPQFCGTCHEMGHNFDTWAASRHGTIKCIDCHAKPGFSGWVQAKMGGMAQLYTHLTATSIKDIHLEQRHRDTLTANCVRCHTETARAVDRYSRVMAHKRHGELGVQCIKCHGANIAHPSPQEAKIPKGGQVDTANCFKCHNGKSVISQKTAFDASAEATCQKCHPDTAFAKDHGGSGSGCLDCHEKGVGKTHYQLDKQNQGALCAKCHDLPKNLNSTHKPFKDGKCSECHRVMVPAYLFRTGPKPDMAFCLRCHDDIAKAVGTAEPAKATPFAEAQKDLHHSHAEDIGRLPELCTRCHAGHGSDAPKALIHLRTVEKDGPPGVYTATPTGGSCNGACHDNDLRRYDRNGTKPEPPPPAPEPGAEATP